ncbi:ATP synthase delta chain, chloroplastic [Malania oleifera]|uniref:ATP synthase delta chain, chloroplastic n=1 Tax=Malania oleifera TaxID=397392 RepID=UPI0025AEA81A|nr:ATP synthase delta chain, chloroplastic [Malania oleifera]
MAALQQSPVTFQSRSPPSTRIVAKLRSQNRVRISFSGSFPSLKLPTLTAKYAGKTKRRGGVMMAESPAPSYASALADVAVSNGALEATSADIEKIENILSDPQVRYFFTCPVIDVEKKREMIEEISSTYKLQPHTANFLNILVDMKRTELIEEIVKEFETVYNKLMDTELAVVSSVVKLEPEHLSQIAKGVQKLTGAKNVRIKTVIDPSLIAGLKISYGSSASKLIDMSVKKQIEEIASQLDVDVNISV